MNTTLAIDLSSSFLSSSKSNDTQITNINKGSCPTFDNIRFWTDADADTVYAYGGDFSGLNPWVGSTTVPLDSFWFFPPNSGGGTWQSLNQWSSVFASITRPNGVSTASGDIGGFNLGGEAGPYSSQKTDIDGKHSRSRLAILQFQLSRVVQHQCESVHARRNCDIWQCCLRSLVGYYWFVRGIRRPDIS